MKFAKNKTTATVIILCMVLILSSTFAAFPLANAHTPPWPIPTYAYMTASPSPIGVGQSALVAFWLNNPPMTASGVGGDRWRNLKVEVTKPDGSKENYGSYSSDPVGDYYLDYTPDQVGTYTFFLSFPGQVLSRYGPTGVVGSTTSAYENDTFLPCNATCTLTVQLEPVAAPPSYPLPQEYWAHPIEGQNTNWYQISSNWLRSPQIMNLVQPDGIAPNTGHVMWTKPISNGGVVGENYSLANGMTFYSGTHYEDKFMDPIIMYGKLYYSLPRSDAASGGGYICVDLLSGQTLWWQNYTTVRPSFGQLLDYETMNQHGVIPNGYLWAINGTSWNAYDPLDGNWLFTLTNVPSGTSFYGPNGEILIYVLDVAHNWLALWNNTAAHDETAASATPSDYTSANYFEWRPVGKTINASDAYSWNVSIPALPSGSTIRAIISDDLILGSPSTFTETQGTTESGTPDPYTMWAINLKPSSRGSMIWLKNYPAPPGNVTRNMPAYRNPLDPVNRVYIMFDKETISYSGYSVDDGRWLWTTQPENPWNMFQHGGIGGAHNLIVNGKLYSSGYSGTVYCYDTKNGNLLWNYNATSGFATPYPGYPIFLFAAADDKIYLDTCEHSANAPYWVGAQARCLNATTGKEIWTIDSTSANAMAIADGYLVHLNLYDMQIYNIGKGPSAITVEAPLNAAPQGSSVVIRGTVTDIAAGTTQAEQKMRFPKGVPAVSDDSMSAWMEYVYMQKPKPTNATGVPVIIDVIDANGNNRNIGKVTSDASGMFTLTWKPDIPGPYKVIATFAGSESYWPSQAKTSFTVDEAGPTASPYPATVLPQTEMYIIGAAAAIIIAIAIGFAITILTLRKRP